MSDDAASPMRALTFPGQGSQAVGMGVALAERFPEARAVLDAVDEALGEKLSALMADGPEDTLTLTRNAQPALMAVSIATLRAIEAATGKTADQLGAYVAGHSLGEYTALAAAGTLEIADAARLLRLRGEAMQTAVPVGEGAMAALLGVDLDDAKRYAAEAAAEGGVCDIANDNATGQVVVSGSKATVERAVAVAAAAGARKSIMLPVSAPFHCALMAPAADAMAEALASVTLRRPDIPLVSNVTASAIDEPSEIQERLVQQVTGMVRWRESVLWMAGQGVGELLEIGAGKVLTGLVRRIDRSVSARAIGSPEDVDAFAEALAG